MVQDLSSSSVAHGNNIFGASGDNILNTPASAPVPAADEVKIEDDSLASTIVQSNETQESLINENPLIAADEDLIEREWVDRAKQIVEATKDNPHQQDDEINKLSVDYIDKRYSKKIGPS
jgi:hypothetical protein